MSSPSSKSDERSDFDSSSRRSATPEFTYTKDPRGLTRILVRLIWLQIFAIALTISSDVDVLLLISSGPFELEEAHASEAWQMWTSAGYLITSLAATIVLLMWVYRANLNCRGFGAEDLRFTPGWAAACFVIPIVSLWMPYDALREIWKASDNPRYWNRLANPRLVFVWWIISLVVKLIGSAGFQMQQLPVSFENYRATTIVSLVGAFAQIVYSIATLSVVTRIAAMQEELTAETSDDDEDPMNANRTESFDRVV